MTAPTPLEAARAEYADCARSVAYHTGWCQVLYEDGWLCPVCGLFSQYADAASVALDMAVAEHWAGRKPRLWSREIPTG